MMASQPIKPGDVVRLKSGGPAMVVESVISGDVVNCVWFSEGRKLQTSFVCQTLERAEIRDLSQGEKRVQ
ncbi:Uncharacterized small protein [Cribrihabitans marinus]|uniref:Uncharacterized small protein n=1 Tax=Cribrihabitans marinus TaxID=1227549 RepID=A0A1H6TZM9_9RHOB|nr:DUF2158 domain-containing protein [Cribrihabitans marinus]GGH21584.1 hypothetical protein GCM10010973_06260 [Cribrihabitans marinus]SEI81202.1 Uncharacterized small protein [Cribrihabitans marinus]